MGSTGIVPYTINLGARWLWVARLTKRPLYIRRRSQLHPLDRRLWNSRYVKTSKNSYV